VEQDLRGDRRGAAGRAAGGRSHKGVQAADPLRCAEARSNKPPPTTHPPPTPPPAPLQVNKVQLDIRQGHAQTVDKVLKWFDEEGGLQGATVADCGCGTGSLSIPLALRGARVSASDISSSMAAEAARRYEAAAAGAGSKGSASFEANDLE